MDSIQPDRSSSREALALVWELQPDMVLMESSMPKMEGIETTAKIKTAYPNEEGVVVKKTAIIDELMKIINKKNPVVPS
ncbi:MAG: response regulator [Desulfovibrionales bacterium]